MLCLAEVDSAITLNGQVMYKCTVRTVIDSHALLLLWKQEIHCDLPATSHILRLKKRNARVQIMIVMYKELLSFFAIDPSS